MTLGEKEAGVSNVLLASDLGCRCDRATERAWRIARTEAARLTVVVAVEDEDRDVPSWRSAATQTRRRAAAELASCFGEGEAAWDLVVGSGSAEEVVLEAAAAGGADLIVCGVARNELLGRSSPGRMQSALIRRAKAPVLIVKRRARNPYVRVLAPTDFSPAAEAALLWAARVFPDAVFDLLHGYRVPFAAFISEEVHMPEMQALAEQQLKAFLARVGAKAGDASRFRALAEFGDPPELVADYDDSLAPDLMVLGAHDRSGPFGALQYDMAGQLIAAVDCDVLVVPQASAAAGL